MSSEAPTLDHPPKKPGITQRRKAREKLQREGLIIREARKILLSKGFQGLNMDDLAETVEYAKGTLYLHFTSKEDLVVAVATHALNERAELLNRATTAAGSTRERMSAVSFAGCEFAHRFPEYFQLDRMLTAQSFWDRASEVRRAKYTEQSALAFRVIDTLVREAMLCGDLADDGLPPDRITFGLVCLDVGTQIMSRDPAIGQLSKDIEKNPLTAVREQQERYLDLLDWKPVSKATTIDTLAIDQKLRETIFTDAKWRPRKPRPKA